MKKEKVSFIKSKKGQSILEFVISMGVIFLIFFFVIQLIFVSGSKMYIHHHLYESLFCIAKGNSKLKCKQEMLKKIKKFVIWGNFESIYLQGRRQKWTGLLIWKLKPWKLQLKRTLTIPEDLL